jgi:CDP-4-dehydro-6-deoxyglucose reductase
VDDLVRVYPHVRLEDDSEFRRVAEIRHKAFGKRIAERVLPDKEVLAARITELGRELARETGLARRYGGLLERLAKRLDALQAAGGEAQRFASELGAWLQQELEAQTETMDKIATLLAKESLLRVTAAHVLVRPSGHEFFVEGTDTILEAALRAGVALDYGCSNGNCGKCKARVLSGQVKKVRHHDYPLTEAEKGQGYVLLCSNTAVSDVEIDAPVAGGVQDMPFQQIEVKVKAVQPLSDEVMLVHVQTPRSHRLRFLAGQGATLHLAHRALAADLPIASCPCNDRDIQFHVRCLPGNLFSDYVFEKLRHGEEAYLEGPHGEFVLRETAQRPLIFVAFDTGFAPIRSLIEHAFSIEAEGPIHLYWFGSSDARIYQANLCRSWTDAFEQFLFTPLVAGSDLETMAARDPGRVAQLLGRVPQDHPDLAEFDVYIAGGDLISAAAEKFFRDYGLPGTRVVRGVVN